MAIGPLPPVISEIQANSGQPGKTLARQSTASTLLELQAAVTADPAAAILPETTLLEKAVAEALGRQGGLAPLYATLVELADSPDLPDAVKAAVDKVLAFRLGDGDVTPARVAEAIRSSGLFHEAVTAGKMAAALPPAVRQALSVTQEEKRQATASPVTPASSPTIPTTATRPAAAVSPSAPSIAVAPVPVAQAHGGQGDLPTETVSSAAAPVPVTSTTGNPIGRSSGPDAPTVSIPASLEPVPAAPLASAAVASSIGASVPPTQAVPTQAVPTQAVATDETPSAPLSVAIGTPTPSALAMTVSRNGPAPVPAQAPAADGEGVRPPMPTAGGVASPFSAAPTAPVATAPVTGLPTPVTAGTEPSPAMPPPPASGPTEAGAPTSPAPVASPSPAAHAPTSSRSFAPWTPGRPMTPATPAALASAAPAGSSPDLGHSAPPPAAGPTGGEPAAPHLAGDRAPFVPSAVESLPDVAPTPTVLRAVAAPTVRPHAAADAPVQSGSVPSTASVPSPQAASGPAVGQDVARPEQAGAQTRPTTATAAETPITPVRQPALPAAGLPSLAGVDLKGALDVLRRELTVWLGRNADVMASLDGVGDDGGAPRADRPVPPRKGGPVRGQPAVSLLEDDETDAVSTETLAGRALGEAERSLSRVFLHQAATADSRDARSAQPTPALIFEIPIAGPYGTSIAQLRVERDDHAPSEPGAPPRRVFQVDIAFDVAPLGPVAVRVGLMDGRRVAVGVWCESDDGLIRMEAERENIVLGLEQEGMIVAGVDLHRGHPPEDRDEMATAPSHRLDLQL